MKIPETMQNIHACEVRKIIKRVLKRAKHYAAISFIKFEQIKIEISDINNFFWVFSVCFIWQNWLPRKVMSAWRIAGILHALEGWTMHECGDAMMDAEKAWSAAISHGFVPLTKAWELSEHGFCNWEMHATLDGTWRCWKTISQSLVGVGQILPGIRANYDLEDKRGTIWMPTLIPTAYYNYMFVWCQCAKLMYDCGDCIIKKYRFGFYVWV